MKQATHHALSTNVQLTTEPSKSLNPDENRLKETFVLQNLRLPDFPMAKVANHQSSVEGMRGLRVSTSGTASLVIRSRYPFSPRNILPLTRGREDIVRIMIPFLQVLV